MNYKGVIIEESLVNKELLELCQIISTRVSHNNDPKTNAGEPKWTLHQVEVTEQNIGEVVNRLGENLKLPNWWADLSLEDEVYIVFHNKIFKGKNYDQEFRKQVIGYAHSLNLPEGQIPFGDTYLV